MENKEYKMVPNSPMPNSPSTPIGQETNHQNFLFNPNEYINIDRNENLNNQPRNQINRNLMGDFNQAQAKKEEDDRIKLEKQFQNDFNTDSRREKIKNSLFCPVNSPVNSPVNV